MVFRTHKLVIPLGEAAVKTLVYDPFEGTTRIMYSTVDSTEKEVLKKKSPKQARHHVWDIGKGRTGEQEATGCRYIEQIHHCKKGIIQVFHGLP